MSGRYSLLPIARPQRVAFFCRQVPGDLVEDCLTATVSVAAYTIFYWATGRFVTKNDGTNGIPRAAHRAAGLAGGERAWDEKSVARRAHGL